MVGSPENPAVFSPFLCREACLITRVLLLWLPFWLHNIKIVTLELNAHVWEVASTENISLLLILLLETWVINRVSATLISGWGPIP